MFDFGQNNFNLLHKTVKLESWKVKEILLTLIVAFLSFFILKRIWKVTQLQKKYLWNIPGPFAFPIIGSSYKFIGNPNQIFNAIWDLMKTYPSGLFYFWHGPYLYFVTDNPKHYEIILSHPNSMGKDFNYKELSVVMGDGLFTSLNVNHWQRHRKVIQPTFKQPILDNFVPIFTENIEILIEIFKPLCGQKDVDLYHYISRYTLDSICETVMGTKVKAQTSDNLFAHHIDKTAELLFVKTFFIFYKIDLIFKLSGKKKMLADSVNYILDYSIKVIKKKKELYKEKCQESLNFDDNNKAKSRKVFLDYLLESNTFDDKELLDEVITLLITATDATAATLSFALTVLGMFPDVQETVREEVISVAGNRTLEHSDLPNLPYLEMVLKETLRLFSVGSYILRTFTDDIDLQDGKILPGGSSVFLFFMNTHRNPKYWKDPLKFDPYRFLPEECAKREPGAFIPFSLGPRNCIGMKYAMMIMKTLIASLVREFTFKCDYKRIEDVKLVSYFVLRPVDGFKVSFEKRQ